MEFIDIDGPEEAQSYLDRGYSVINNVSLVPMRLHAFQADLYAGKWAAVKGGNDYLDKLVSKGTLSILSKTVAAPTAVASEVASEEEAPKAKKKAKEIQEEPASVTEETPVAEPAIEVVDENKDVEVQESTQ